MEKNNEKRSQQAQDEQQPGDLSSFNRKDTDRRTEAEDALKPEQAEKGSNEMDSLVERTPTKSGQESGSK